MRAPASGEDWIATTDAGLDQAAAVAWATVPSCGAVVAFSGTVRDHAAGRPGVSSLTYEAYEGRVEQRMAEMAAGARRRWGDLGRVVLWHRTGTLGLTETSVVVVVSAPHRAAAFEAARWVIDTAKEALPIWKHETWAGGSGWGTCAHDAATVDGRAGDPAADRVAS